MRKSEMLFLLLVAAFAVALSVMTIANFSRTTAKSSSSLNAPLGQDGMARDVDMVRVKRMIEQKYLSGREALFYTKSPLPIPRAATAQTNEPAPDHAAVEPPPSAVP